MQARLISFGVFVYDKIFLSRYSPTTASTPKVSNYKLVKQPKVPVNSRALLKKFYVSIVGHSLRIHPLIVSITYF